MKNKKLYTYDRTTYFAQVAKDAKREKLLASPFTYTPNPLLHRKDSAKVKGSLKQSDERVTLPVEA